jgi:replicative DNA helicase
MPPRKRTAANPAEPKMTPNNLEAEQSTLGCLLIDQNAIYKIADLITPSDFYVPAHQKIFQSILELTEKNKPFDVMSLTNHLREKGILKDIGGSGYIAELTNYVTTASHVTHYAEIVREKKILRDLISASAEITEDALAGGTEDIETLMDAVEQKIFSIAQRSTTQNFVPIKEELKGAYDRIERLHEHKDVYRGVPTGFTKLDNLLSGLQKSNLIVLAARPSLGKTTFAIDIAKHAAIKHKVPVGIFSLEMSREEVVDRFIASSSNVSLWRLRTGHVSSETDFQMIQQGLDVLNDAPIFIEDTASPTMLSMRAQARRLQMQHGLGLIIVDYLQLISPRRGNDNIVAQVTEISRGLKALARDLNVPVLAVSQLNRSVEQRDNKRPQLHDLRDSGSIEQDADVVMFIYRKDRDRQDLTAEEQNVAEILVAKHRNGPLGAVKLQFEPDAVSFREIDERYQEPEL